MWQSCYNETFKKNSEIFQIMGKQITGIFHTLDGTNYTKIS